MVARAPRLYFNSETCVTTSFQTLVSREGFSQLIIVDLQVSPELAPSPYRQYFSLFCS